MAHYTCTITQNLVLERYSKCGTHINPFSGLFLQDGIKSKLIVYTIITILLQNLYSVSFNDTLLIISIMFLFQLAVSILRTPPCHIEKTKENKKQTLTSRIPIKIRED